VPGNNAGHAALAVGVVGIPVWVSPSNAQRVVRVLAVADGIVREVNQPARWLPSPVEGPENRIGFEGVVAVGRERYVSRDVTHLFRHRSANPVRYLPLDALIEDATVPLDPAFTIPAEQVLKGAVEPGLLERILPLLDAFESDLLWAHSRAAGISIPTQSHGCWRTSPSRARIEPPAGGI
jgi:hypothetical protein